MCNLMSQNVVWRKIKQSKYLQQLTAFIGDFLCSFGEGWFEVIKSLWILVGTLLAGEVWSVQNA